jgi:hypothetical protein
MTLDELANTLPNGFHDSAVHTITLDYSKHEIRFHLAVWVGDLDAKDEKAREAYRMGDLTLSDMAFCVIEPPDPRYPYYEKDEIIIDTGEVDKLSRLPTIQLPPVQKGMFVNWMFVQEWNSFIYVTARDARLRWCT